MGYGRAHEPKSRNRRWAWRAMLAIALLQSTGCAGQVAALEVAASRPPMKDALALEAPAGWRQFEVRRSGFRKRVEIRDLATSEVRELRYRGIPVAWASPLSLAVDPRIYERRSHRAAFRFQDPWSRRNLILRAHGKSQRLHGVPLPLSDDNIALELLVEGNDQPCGRFEFSPGQATLISGEIEGRRLRIETIDGLPIPSGGLREILLGSFPLAGTYRVAASNLELARIVQHHQEGAISRYRLAIPHELTDEARYDAWLAFFVFDLMKDFVHSAD